MGVKIYDIDGKLITLKEINRLNDIDDLDVPTPTDGYVPYWDEAAGKWKSKEMAGMTEHGPELHTNATRELFLPAAQAIGDGTAKAESTADVPIMEVPDAADSKVYFPYFKVPDDFVSFLSAKLVWNASAAGNMYWQLTAAYGAVGEVLTKHQDTPTMGVTAGAGMGQFDVQEPATPLTFTELAKGDHVAIRFRRDATHEDDTITGVVNLIGLVFEYTAEQ